jgi:hypothetical protein
MGRICYWYVVRPEYFNSLFLVTEAPRRNQGYRYRHEIAKRTPSMGLEYSAKVRQIPSEQTLYPAYRGWLHYACKGCITNWFKAQASLVNEDGTSNVTLISSLFLSWVISGPYMDMLNTVSHNRRLLPFRDSTPGQSSGRRISAQMVPSCSHPLSPTVAYR